MLGCVCCAPSVVFCNVCDFDVNAVVACRFVSDVGGMFWCSGGVSTGGCLNILLGWVLFCVQSFVYLVVDFVQVDCCFFGFVFLGLGLKDGCVGSVAEIDNCVGCV